MRAVRCPGGHHQGAEATGASGGWTSTSVAIRSGAPSIVLEGNAKRRADMLGITKRSTTFTHEKTNAVAFAVAVGE